MRVCLYFIVSLFSICSLNAQTEKRTINIERAIDAIELDGRLYETTWQNATSYSDFNKQYPIDEGTAEVKTEVQISYDSDFLYVAAKCFYKGEKKTVVQSLKRDFSFPVTDAFAIFLDTFNDQTSGFSFAVNPYGSQREGALVDGGASGVTTAWDQAWHSVTSFTNEYWIAEIAIPFSSIRFKPDSKSWGINFARNDLSNNEVSCWNFVPKNFNVANMVNFGTLVWDNPIEKGGINATLIPYYSIGFGDDYTKGTRSNLSNAGIDAKIGLTASLNLDLTVNPDFSQIEVDRQVTNLTRFSISFPEKRNFFLENADLFSNLGFPQIRPFFSRRIGLNAGEIVPILYGARLSGKVNKNWRVGAMNLQTGLNSDNSNYSLAVVERKVLKRSSIVAFTLHKQSFNDEDINDFNRIYGTEWTYRSNKGKSYVETFFQKAYTEDFKDNNNAFAIFASQNEKKFRLRTYFQRLEDNYTAEVGFTPRLFNYDALLNQTFRDGYFNYFASGQYWFYPKADLIFRHGPIIETEFFFNNDWEETEQEQVYSYEVEFQSGAKVSADFISNQVQLKYYTDILRADFAPLPPQIYQYNSTKLAYRSDRRKKLSYNFSSSYGGFYNGTRFNFSGDATYRINPKINLAANFTNDIIEFAEPYGNTTLTSFGFNKEISFTTNLYWTTYLQFNTQAETIGVNSRFQWRYKPMSDLFLVYTDNYDNSLNELNRAFILKMVYWFGI